MTRHPDRAVSQAMAGPGCDQAEGLLLGGSARSPRAEIPLPRKELWP